YLIILAWNRSLVSGLGVAALRCGTIIFRAAEPQHRAAQRARHTLTSSITIILSTNSYIGSLTAVFSVLPAFNFLLSRFESLKIQYEHHPECYRHAASGTSTCPHVPSRTIT